MSPTLKKARLVATGLAGSFPSFSSAPEAFARGVCRAVVGLEETAGRDPWARVLGWEAAGSAFLVLLRKLLRK